ncbi:hypothetical protein E4U11_003883 [Claviceps purpurea]|nr:hypothetical protein E4U11_003883 [Claviceps purpurea]
MASTLAKDREATSQEISTVSSPDTCDDDDESEKPKESKANMHFNEQGDLVADDDNERSTSFQQELDIFSARTRQATSGACQNDGQARGSARNHSKTRSGTPRQLEIQTRLLFEDAGHMQLDA